MNRRFSRQTPAVSTTAEMYKIQLRESGIYRLDLFDLRKAGINPATLDPRKITLTHRGKPVPIEVNGGADGHDFITFYGAVNAADYSPYTVYWLSVGDADGLRMKRADAAIKPTAPVPKSFLSTIHEEQNKSFRHWATFPNSERVDRFFWERIFAGDRFAFDVNLPFLADTDADCTVRVMLQGNTALAHHTRISLNGQLLEDATWRGQTQHLAEIRTPQTLLRQGRNTLRVEMPGDVGEPDIVYFNWFEIDYHQRYVTDTDRLEFRSPGNGAYRFVIDDFRDADIRVYDITDIANPVRVGSPKIERVDGKYRVSFGVENRVQKAAPTYIVLTSAEMKTPAKIIKESPSHLRSTENGADYLLITHSDFYDSVLPLKALRERGGLRVEVVDVADIYDEFNHGLQSDAAIRDFIAHAYHHWKPPSPAFVLLVGDASYDHKDFYGAGGNYVPTHLFNAPYFGDSASDGWFVTVSGDDPLPDLMIGRLPIRTAAQARAVIEKIIRYEQNPAPGDWQRRILLSADDGKIFEQNSEAIAAKNLTDYDVTKVYLSRTPQTSAQRTVFDTLNQGCVVANYTGHGSWNRWAKEKILQTADIELLNNADRLPFVINVTCLAGFFAHPLRDNILSENLVRAEGRGAVAALAACGMATASWQNLYNKLIFDQLFAGERRNLGSTVTTAKIALIAQRGRVGDSGIYNLLGDPALKLALPQSRIAEDVNADGRVDILDLVLIGSHFGERITAPVQPNPDVNGDGVVNILDLVSVGARFGEESGVMAAPQTTATAETVTVWLESSPQTDKTVSLKLKGKSTAAMHGIQWSLNFDPERLEFVKVSDGNFLSQDGGVSHWQAPKIDTLNGQLIGAATTRLTEHGISGEGVLATLSFRVKTADADPFNGLYLTDVHAVSTDGRFSVIIDESDFDKSRDIQPGALKLRRVLNIPNPMKRNCYFTYTLTQDAAVTIKIYTVSGRLIRTLEADSIAAYNEVFWDGRDENGTPVANGVYLYSVIADDGQKRVKIVKKLAVLR